MCFLLWFEKKLFGYYNSSFFASRDLKFSPKRNFNDFITTAKNPSYTKLTMSKPTLEKILLQRSLFFLPVFERGGRGICMKYFSGSKNGWVIVLKKRFLKNNFKEGTHDLTKTCFGNYGHHIVTPDINFGWDPQ